MISIASSHESQLHPLESPPPPTSPPPTTIFRSRLPDIHLSNHLPLHSYIFENTLTSSSPCIICASSGTSYSYAETLLLSLKTASFLSSTFHIQKGDVILLLLQNCPEFVFSFLACSILGAVSTSANPFSTPSELEKHISMSQPKLVITHSSYLHKVQTDSNISILTTDDFIKITESEPTGIPEAQIDPDDVLAMPFSSGTTGLPKGVELTHRSLISSVGQVVDGENPNLYLREGEEVMLCVLPLFHVFSLNSVLLAGMRRGAVVVLMGRFEMRGMLEVIQRWRVTVAAVVPPLVLALAKSEVVGDYDLGSVTKVLSGAAPLGKELEDGLRLRLPQAVLGQGYGMTEAGPVISMCPAFAKRPTPAKSGSCGTVVRNAELKVIDPETGFSLGRNQPGEICVRGPQIMKGYLNNPEATSSTIDTEGWLHTGDIGYVDHDDEIFIVDRVKELIKFKGFQVPPAELESLLISHPCIADAAVIPQKDEAAGEVPVAFVVQANDSDIITEESVKEFISKQVVFYKRLQKVYFVPAIPKSPSGKILRKDLRARLASYSS